MRSWMLLVLTVVASVCLDIGYGRELPSQVKLPEIAEHYREQNLCPYLGVESSSVDFNFWTCTIPQKISYCGLRTKFVYDCCPGFIKSALANKKCAETQSVWRLLPDYLATYGYGAFANILNSGAPSVGLNNNSTAEVYTVFVPYKESVYSLGDVNLNGNFGGNDHPILAHITKTRSYSHTLKDKTVLTSLYSNQKLKVTVYSNNLVFIECRALIKPDMEARNGLIHLISGPIAPHSSGSIQRKSVLQALETNSATSAFAADIPSDIKSLLAREDSAEWYTVFAPKNSAWQTAKSRYSKDLRPLVLNHIIKRIICSQSITERATSLGPTLADEYIGVDCTASIKRFVLDTCGSQIAINQADLMAGNGVVHVIDQAIVPTSVMSLDEALQCYGQTTGIDIRTTLEEWRSCSITLSVGSRYVVLAPLQEAHDWFRNYEPFKSEYNRFKADSVYRCNTYKYHVLKLESELRSLDASWWNQVGYKTFYTFEGAYSVNFYEKHRHGSMLYFEYSRTKDLKAIRFREGFIYFMDRINVIPEKLRVDILRERPILSLISEKVGSSGHGAILRSKGPFSLFLAPRNRGWSKTRVENKYTGTILMNYLKLHTINLRLWGDDIGYYQRETYQVVETLLMDASGKPFQLKFKRMLNGNMFIGYDTLPEDEWAMVLEWNLYGTDGIIWVIDWPIKCPVGLCDTLTLPEKDYFAVYATACIIAEGVASVGEYSRDPLPLARKHSDKCVVFKLPPKVSYREWEVPSGGRF